jgi:glycosyl-4,4'-diaponeurosporenoate acyltransferase
VRIIHLSTFWTIVVDCIAWAILQPAIAYVCIKLPSAALRHDRWLFEARGWERGGAIYDTLFRVRRWKSLLPSGGTLFGGFSMKRIVALDHDYLRTWIIETCRAELCHWLVILPSFLFFLWNPFYLAVVMLLYALLINVPLIVIQRYNRPRLLEVARRRAVLDAHPPFLSLQSVATPRAKSTIGASPSTEHSD